MQRMRRETVLQEGRDGPQTRALAPECPDLRCSTNYPEASTFRGEAQTLGRLAEVEMKAPGDQSMEAR
jgi:hypothetical protein